MFDFKMCFRPQQRALFRHLNFQKRSELLSIWLPNMLRATTACTFRATLPKVLRHCRVFQHVDFKMCFAPQQRALFRHLNFQKWSERVFFCILTTKSASHFAPQRCALFPHLNCPKMFQAWGVFSFLTSKSASRQDGVQFFISHLARWLRTRRFSEPTFRPSRATKHWRKHSVSRLFYLFAHLDLLSSASFSSLIFFLLPFSSLTFLESAFPSVHTVGSLWKFDF